MKRALGLVIATFAVVCSAAETPAKGDYPIAPVPFTDVQITDAFWGPRQETNRTATIPYVIRMCEETGRIDNFMVAGKLKEGKFVGRRYNDSDVFKAMEAAACSLRTNPDPELRKKLDELVVLVGKAQEIKIGVYVLSMGKLDVNTAERGRR